MARRREADEPFSLFSFMDIVTSLIGIMFLIVILLVLDLMSRTFEAEAAPETAAAEAARLPALQRQVAMLEEELERQLAAASARAAAPEETPPAPEPDDAGRAEAEAEVARLQALLDKARTEEQEADAEIRQRTREVDALTRELAEEQRRLAEHRARTEQPDPLRRMVTLPGTGVVKTVVLVECEKDGLRAIVLAKGARMQTWGRGFSNAFRLFRQWTQTLKPPERFYFLVYVPSEAMSQSMNVVEWLRGTEYFGVGYEPLLPGMTAVYNGVYDGSGED